MTATMLDGRPLAARMLDLIAARVDGDLSSRPHLAIVQVGGDAASTAFVAAKCRAARRAHITTLVTALPFWTTAPQLLEVLAGIQDPAGGEPPDGLILQRPLPPSPDYALHAPQLAAAILPVLDVDGGAGTPYDVPVALAVVELLAAHGLTLLGPSLAPPVLVGYGPTAGRPIAAHLMARYGILPHILTLETPDNQSLIRSADVLIVAAGHPYLITPADVKPGSTVIDVGATRVEATLTNGVVSTTPRLVGDVDPRVADVAAALSPVPGGVGPLTVAFLLQNTLHAAQRRHTLPATAVQGV